MKALFESKRTRAILGIGIVAIGIALKSKKVIIFKLADARKGAKNLLLIRKK